MRRSGDGESRPGGTEKREYAEAEKRARAYLKEHPPIASWGKRIHLCQDSLVRPGLRWGRTRRPAEIVPLDGVHAELGSAAPNGGWRKPIESRQVWLTISGTTFHWQDPVPRTVTEPAREFANAVNERVAVRSGESRRQRKKRRRMS